MGNVTMPSELFVKLVEAYIDTYDSNVKLQDELDAAKSDAAAKALNAFLRGAELRGTELPEAEKVVLEAFNAGWDAARAINVSLQREAFEAGVNAGWDARESAYG